MLLFYVQPWACLNRDFVCAAGYVRRASARLMPNLNGNHMTIGRPRSLDDLEDMEQGRRNGKH